MDGTVILEWTFTPKDFFEEDIEFDALGHRVQISAGKIKTTISGYAYGASVERDLHEIIEARLRAGLFLGHSSYKLSKPDKTVVHPDGRRDLYVRAESGCAAMVGGKPDIRIVDIDGRIIADTRRERIDKRNDTGALLSKHLNDGVLNGMIDSYERAVKDASDELVHLYEIRGAVAKAFGNENAAKQALGVSGRKWDQFGRICNDSSLRQGRHRGEKEGELRNATNDELEAARRFACSLIDGHVHCLEMQSTE